MPPHTKRGGSARRGNRAASKPSTPRKGARLSNTRRRPAHTVGEKNPKTSNADELLDADVDRDATVFFTKNVTFAQHLAAQRQNRDKYVATVIAFNDYGIEIVPNARARSLAAAFARNDKPLLELFLGQQQRQQQQQQVIAKYNSLRRPQLPLQVYPGLILPFQF